ncbi:MAG TPA: tripartite tricarboxylate transporter substrate binding protein [Noviherbaspirillum sp.]|jgi:tripartite-type tricarboxylate transporter receptor subunit TctC|uniref:Bug family tripartite tricarboxylate transporter substrate binding protein n=1 Tax=Noviherbaspirillum sp. TaxID=1926288 RepID=UPI002DDDA23B|nr:tripartite tricarboxylate transporter substrate binding protein [Noviherbaspirillum sp.]HEV2612866.1 tripartite tricarboxylate transporter substrate binding protein [Noviherbaspirillum sp.]
MNTRRIFLAAALLLPLSAFAQSWPARPVTFIVPFPAGGGTDAFARPLAAQLTKQLGRQVIIDNRGGAGGTLGAGIAAKAAPDGYTFFIGGAHHAIAPSIYPKLDYDIQKDFTPIALVATPPQVIVVNPQKVPATDLKSFLDFVKKNPGKLNYGSAGNGTSHHLAGELFKMQTKTFITHIPYRGAGPALQDLVAGQVDMMFDGLGSSAPHLKGGRIKALAVASATRAPGFPDVPTAAEAGVPGYEVSTWYGMWAPRGTPPDVVERMAAEVQKALASPELKTAWNNSGSDIPQLTQAKFGAMVDAEIKRWAAVVKAAGVKLE